jgi:hypothetical protein
VGISDATHFPERRIFIREHFKPTHFRPIAHGTLTAAGSRCVRLKWMGSCGRVVAES